MVLVRNQLLSRGLTGGTCDERKIIKYLRGRVLGRHDRFGFAISVNLLLKVVWHQRRVCATICRWSEFLSSGHLGMIT